MMTAYVTVVLGTLYTFGIVRDYNRELFDGVVSSALVETDKTVAGMILVAEIAFCAAAAHANRRLKKIDLIASLKDECY